jgi:hypothetical protein
MTTNRFNPNNITYRTLPNMGEVIRQAGSFSAYGDPCVVAVQPSSITVQTPTTRLCFVVSARS